MTDDDNNIDDTRQRIAAAHGIADADRDLFLGHSDDPDRLEHIAEQLAKRLADPDRRLVVPKEGRNPGPPVDHNADLREFVAALFTTYPYN